jgi:hypothetical protein
LTTADLQLQGRTSLHLIYLPLEVIAQPHCVFNSLARVEPIDDWSPVDAAFLFFLWCFILLAIACRIQACWLDESFSHLIWTSALIAGLLRKTCHFFLCLIFSEFRIIYWNN